MHRDSSIAGYGLAMRAQDLPDATICPDELMICQGELRGCQGELRIWSEFAPARTASEPLPFIDDQTCAKPISAWWPT